jgi:hypothetical protein
MPDRSTQRSPAEVGSLRSQRFALVGEIRRLQRAQRRTDAPLYAFVEACAVQPWWGGRDMLLFNGALHRVKAIGSLLPSDERLRRRGPQWWWPEDKSWFVATEIDYPWSYVAGSSALIDSLIGDPNLEAIRVDASKRW